ncbi:MAG: ADP-ribosylglycohydrolase family protein [Ornithinimicrobium sp.]
MKFTEEQLNRAAGVVLTQACGDALGVPYEMAEPPRSEPAMIGGGLGDYAPGEWSDDTQMSVCILTVAATGADLTSDQALRTICQGFRAWYADNPADIGIHTRSVLREDAATDAPEDPAAMLRASEAVHRRTGQSAGNGALMRTGIVGLTRLADREATAQAAREAARVTHWDDLAGESGVLWCEAIRVAVIEGELDLASGVDLLPIQRRTRWLAIIDEAATSDPRVFTGNGFTVTALQAAWSSIVKSSRSATEHPIRGALHTAISVGNDTDTVAAITGALVGARYGASAVPRPWRRMVHGWPGMDGESLVRLATLTAGQGQFPVTTGTA